MRHITGGMREFSPYLRDGSPGSKCPRSIPPLSLRLHVQSGEGWWGRYGSDGELESLNFGSPTAFEFWGLAQFASRFDP